MVKLPYLKTVKHLIEQLGESKVRVFPYPSVTEEFTVAAVTVLSFFLIGGGGGGGAMLRAAVLILALLSFIWLVLIVPFTAMTLTVWITDKNILTLSI